METWPPFFYEDIMKTKREILEWAKSKGITICYTDKGFYKWVVMFAPIGQWFVNDKAHEVEVWSSEDAPDWECIGKDLLSNSQLIPCPVPDCTWCEENA